MSYTIKKVAELSGVTVRTLQYYDELGLLSPSHRSEAGYRHYEEEQLLRLQQILFYRELGLDLKTIQKILNGSDFNKIAALVSHRETLEKRIVQAKHLVETINQTLRHLKGEKTMQPKDMYHGFSKEQQEAYEQHLVDSCGGMAEELIAQSKERTKTWKKDDWQQVKKGFEQLHQELSKALEKQESPDAPAVQQLIGKHYALIERFYAPSQESYAGLGKLYVDHPDFRQLLDDFHPKLAEFMARAMRVFAKRNL